MEELFCIGCGAQIQTEDKEKAVNNNYELISLRGSAVFSSNSLR